MTREEAKTILRSLVGSCPLKHDEWQAVEYAIEALKEPKQGEWKRISADKYIRHATHFFRCSVCGEDTIGDTNFCPNCGARMTH